MKAFVLLSLGLLCVSPAMAQEPAAGSADALDLKLPPASIPPYPNDPPGTYYGDTSGVPAGLAASTAKIQPRCPTSPQGEERDITGSFTTGIGYSSRGGNSHWNALNLNYCKEMADEDGDSRTFNFNLHMEQYDGPGFYGPRPGPARTPRR